MSTPEPAAPNPSARKRRVALYSHDTMGIGHMRRNLLIAEALAGSSLSPSVLVIAGVRGAGTFPLRPGIDCLTLPSLAKEGEGCYHARGLGVALRGLRDLRALTLGGALGASHAAL